MTSLHQAGMGPVRQLAYHSNTDRSQPDTPSSRRKPCPICGRTKDGDCTHSADMAFCHHGSSLAPPSGLTRGDVITGEDGRSWAYVSTADGASGTTSTFVLDRPSASSTRSHRPIPRTISKPAKPMPAAIPTEPITLATIKGATLADGMEDAGKGIWHINYSPTLVSKRVPKVGKDGKPDKDFFAHHLNGASPELTSGAGPEAWPLWHQVDLETVELGNWILETEGETCSNYARTGGIVSISQPGHARTVKQRAERYAAIAASNAAGIIYLADNDPQGRRFADDAREAAAIAGVPIVVVHAGELHEQMPPGGSIDDLCRATDHPTKPGFGVPAAAAIELILEHARQKQDHQGDTYPVTTTTKPAYLEPTDSVQVQPQCAYEPPLSVGTQIRMGEPLSLEERTLRYEHCRTGEPMELVTDNPAAFEIAGFQDVEHWTMDRESNEFKYDGSRRCAYAVTGEEKPYDPEEHLQEVLKGEAFQAVCERDKVKGPEAHLRANRLQWLCPSNTWSGRKYFTLGAGEFHSALIGGEWIPCVREKVRTRTQPVLGWAASNRQAAYRPRSGTENGHKGIVRKQGKYARESTIERRRWTTTLSIEALEVLDRMSSEMGLHRNEVVEQLVARAMEYKRSRYGNLMVFDPLKGDRGQQGPN